MTQTQHVEGRAEDHSNDHDDEKEEEEEDTLLFSCRCESAKAISTLLSSLRYIGKGASANTDASERNYWSGSKAQICAVYVTENAVTFHVHGVARQSQATADLQAGLFSDYYVCSEEVMIDDENGGEPKKEVIVGGEFHVNLTTVLECISVLGQTNLDRTRLCMSYDRETCIFRLELEENGVISTCAIMSSTPETNIDDDDPSQGLAIAFRNDKVVARAIVKSDYLKDAVNELIDMKQAGATCCTVGISSDRIEMGASGHSGDCLLYLPKNSEVFVSLHCDPPDRNHFRSYPLNSFLQGMRGLEIANETCVSLNEKGMIAIQHQVLDTVGSGQPNYIDFIMGSLEEEEDDDYEEDNEEDEDDSDTQSLQHAVSHSVQNTLRSQTNNENTQNISYTTSQTNPKDRSNKARDQTKYSDTSDESDEDKNVEPSLIVGRASRKRQTPSKVTTTPVTLTHQTVHTHYSDSSEDEYEFN